MGFQDRNCQQLMLDCGFLRLFGVWLLSTFSAGIQVPLKKDSGFLVFRTYHGYSYCYGLGEVLPVLQGFSRQAASEHSRVMRFGRVSRGPETVGSIDSSQSCSRVRESQHQTYMRNISTRMILLVWAPALCDLIPL